VVFFSSDVLQIAAFLCATNRRVLSDARLLKTLSALAANPAVGADQRAACNVASAIAEAACTSAGRSACIAAGAPAALVALTLSPAMRSSKETFHMVNRALQVIATSRDGCNKLAETGALGALRALRDYMHGDTRGVHVDKSTLDSTLDSVLRYADHELFGSGPVSAAAAAMASILSAGGVMQVFFEILRLNDEFELDRDLSVPANHFGVSVISTQYVVGFAYSLGFLFSNYISNPFGVRNTFPMPSITLPLILYNLTYYIFFCLAT